MTNKEPIPAKLQEFIDGLIKLKKDHNLPDDIPIFIKLGNKKGTTQMMTVPLITVEMSPSKKCIWVGSQASLDEIVKHFKIFDKPEGGA